MSEINTPQGTDDVQADHSGNIPDYVFHDPDEDTEASAELGMTEDDGTAETDDDLSTEEAETEANDEAEEGQEDEGEEGEGEQPEPEYLDLPDGTKIDREEAVKGYLRQSDYTRKSQEVAELRKAVASEQTRIENITNAFVDHLSQMIPAAPDPALAYQDPNAYTRQKAAHEAAVAQVQQLIEVGEQAKQAGNNISEADRRKIVAEQNRMLAEKYPATASQKGRTEFFNNAATAAQQAGFSLDELQGVSDHRLFVLAHWANEGMKAKQARDKAKQKAAKAPPATPTKPGQPKKQNRNAEAMRRLSKSGSIRDALAIDFD